MRQIKALIQIFVMWTLMGMVWKIPFMIMNSESMPDVGVMELLQIMWHGLRLDVAIAGYLSIIPALMLIVFQWYRKKLSFVWKVYFGLTVGLVSLAYMANIGLYSYWGFPLDNTPLLYLTTSPGDALASMTTGQLFVAPLFIMFLIYLFGSLFSGIYVWCEGDVAEEKPAKIVRSVILGILGALLILPIRGGVSTGTNHTGSVYFSNSTPMNHAAVNPVFSFMEAMLHKEEIGTRYRFMADNEADALFCQMTYTKLRDNAPAKTNYNVVMVCLESFSKYIMEEKEHVSDVTPNLDKLTKQGLYFTNIYANSFRTDRAIVSVFSALPAQPTMSVMDMPSISTSLPSIASTLQRDGYDTHFYYGGDANYSNMNSYLLGIGFGTLTTEKGFTEEQRTGKWGVPDGTVFERMLNDIETHTRQKADKPFFKAFMTGSSHEPFDVPHYNHLPQPELNAFSYTDNALGKFVDKLRKSSAWKNTLLVIVPDHMGAWPQQMDNFQLWRYEIPLIIMGGPIKTPKRIDTVGSQIDIAATLLALTGRQHEEFTYSKDLLDPAAPHFAFFTVPDAMGYVDNRGHVIYDNTSSTVVSGKGEGEDSLLYRSQAYLQKLYDDLETRRAGRKKKK